MDRDEIETELELPPKTFCLSILSGPSSNGKIEPLSQSGHEVLQEFTQNSYDTPDIKRPLLVVVAAFSQGPFYVPLNLSRHLGWIRITYQMASPNSSLL